MNAWYLLAFPAWIIVIITAAARLADLGNDHWAIRHHVRRIGLIGVGAIAVVMVATPFTADRWFYSPSTWRGTMIAWSWAIVWLTTEGLPPWYDYILGVHRQTEQWKTMGWRARLRGEWQALRASFRPRRLRAPMTGPQGPMP